MEGAWGPDGAGGDGREGREVFAEFGEVGGEGLVVRGCDEGEAEEVG